MIMGVRLGAMAVGKGPRSRGSRAVIMEKLPWRPLAASERYWGWGPRVGRMGTQYYLIPEADVPAAVRNNYRFCAFQMAATIGPSKTPVVSAAVHIRVRRLYEEVPPPGQPEKRTIVEMVPRGVEEVDEIPVNLGVGGPSLLGAIGLDVKVQKKLRHIRRPLVAGGLSTPFAWWEISRRVGERTLLGTFVLVAVVRVERTTSFKGSATLLVRMKNGARQTCGSSLTVWDSEEE